jgi:hypothetical protein
MKHITALIVKFLIITLALEIVLGMLTNLTFSEILSIAVTITVVAYIVGDLLILPISNNTIATIADIGLAAITIYAFNYLRDYGTISIVDSLIAAVVIGMGEWFFHKYIAHKIFHRHNTTH